MRDLRVTQLRRGAPERCLIWDTDHNKIGHTLIVAAERDEVIDGMIRLDDLLREGNIGADENVNVSLVRDLCHGEIEYLPLAESCQEKKWWVCGESNSVPSVKSRVLHHLSFRPMEPP